MGYFIAYKHTGEDPKKLEALLTPLRDTLVAHGEEMYCTFFDDDSFRAKVMGPAEIMHHAFRKIEALGTLLVVLDSPDRSEGMLMEVGYCIAKSIPIIVARRTGVENTYVPDMAQSTFAYSSPQDLARKVGSL